MQPHLGAFITCFAPQIPSYDNIILWPNARWGSTPEVPHWHNLSCEYAFSVGAPQHIFYDWGIYNTTAVPIYWNPTWANIECTQTISYTVAASKTSNRTAFAWMHCREPGYPGLPGQTFTQLNNDVYLVIDDDGLNVSFANPINVTNFLPPDSSLLPDSLHADRDTLRAYTDIDLLFDHNDYLHVAFTTRAYFSFEQQTYPNASIIWHWSEQHPDSFRMIANQFYPNDTVDCGVWQTKVQRPCLGEGSPPDYRLYCLYHQYDTDSTHLSAAGWPSGEVYLTVSTNGGLSWAQGTNITNTLTPFQAPPGSCLSELTPTMDDQVDNYCHLTYVLDRDAGNVIQSEGSWTLNPVKYHRVPISQIPTTPLLPQIYNLHVWPPQPLNIALFPLNFPIVIPPGGGRFDFTVTISTYYYSQSFDAWAMIKLPNGSLYGPVLGPVLNLTLPFLAVITRNRSQNVPGSAPAGYYQYIAYVGDYTSPTVYTVEDSAYFPFTKSSTDQNSPLQSWSNAGEPFEGELVAAPDNHTLKISAAPNPFNPTTVISFELRAASFVHLKVYDTAGRLVETLVEGWREAGTHQVTFDGARLGSGIYLYTLKADGYTASGKMALVK